MAAGAGDGPPARLRAPGARSTSPWTAPSAGRAAGLELVADKRERPHWPARAPTRPRRSRLDAVGRPRAELIEALGTLPPRQRAVLVLRYFEDLTEAQVAELLGCSVGTVKSTASRGLTRLQSALTPDISLSTKEHTR